MTYRMMLAAALSLLAAAPLRAQTQAPELERKVTVRVQQAPLATLLDTLSAQAKVNFILTEGFEGRTVTAFLKNVTVREVLDILAATRGLSYRRVSTSASYLVGAKGKEAPPLALPDSPRLARRVSVHVKNSPLARFLDVLSDQADVNFVLAEGLEGRQVTAFLKNVTVREALEIVLAVKDLDCRPLGPEGTYLIARRGSQP